MIALEYVQRKWRVWKKKRKFEKQETWDGNPGSEEAGEQVPDGEEQQEDDADGVGDAVPLREGVPEPTGCSDMLLQQIAPDCNADSHPHPLPSYTLCKHLRRHHQQKNQRSRHLHPLWEMPRKEKPEHNCNECNPFTNFSPAISIISFVKQNMKAWIELDAWSTSHLRNLNSTWGRVRKM